MHHILRLVNKLMQVKAFFKKTGKNIAEITILTSEWIDISFNHGYGFSDVKIELDLQFWGDGYGIIKGGQVSRTGKYWNNDYYTYIENEIESLEGGVFGTFPY